MPDKKKEEPKTAGPKPTASGSVPTAHGSKPMADEKELFWADQLADKIISRAKFHYLDNPAPKLSEFVVKTSASLSGVLHIGRLSDTIRGATVFKALKDAGAKARIIWVAEDMDPLRKVPAGVPKDYIKYLGMPVTDVPDSEGCHSSYAEHHKAKYFEVIDRFVDSPLEKFSMREEYKKGNFNELIKAIIAHADEVREIQDRYRTNPLPKGWYPWQPICENCGKIATTRVSKVEDGKAHYTCKDYYFETTKAEGCGHKGVADPMGGEGKLAWKSEWAAQWARWKVCSEGAGKEYQVPNSAFWINAEICEKILSFPMPEPIFYEHLLIDNVKMSASVGNVIYPADWLEVALPEILRFFYNKRLMKTRSFSWQFLPNLYDEFDEAARIYFGLDTEENKKEAEHIKRLYFISNNPGHIRKPVRMSYAHASVLCQLFDKNEDIVASLKKTGHYDRDVEDEIFDRIGKSRVWLAKHAPAEAKFKLNEALPENLPLNDKQKEAMRAVAKILKQKEWDEKELGARLYELCKELGIKSDEFYRAGYQVLLSRDKGPRLAGFLITLGERARKLLEKV